MKRILATVALIVAASSLASSQTTQSQSGQAAAAGQTGGSAEQEVLRIHDEYGKAIVRGDAGVHERVLADDYTLITPTGEVLDKSRLVESVKSGNWKYESGQGSDLRTRVYGDTVVVTGIWTTKGQFKGKPFNRKERYTSIYVKRNGRWQVVAEQLTNIAAQPQGQQQQSSQ